MLGVLKGFNKVANSKSAKELLPFDTTVSFSDEMLESVASGTVRISDQNLAISEVRSLLRNLKKMKSERATVDKSSLKPNKKVDYEQTITTVDDLDAVSRSLLAIIGLKKDSLKQVNLAHVAKNYKALKGASANLKAIAETSKKLPKKTQTENSIANFYRQIEPKISSLEDNIKQLENKLLLMFSSETVDYIEQVVSTQIRKEIQVLTSDFKLLNSNLKLDKNVTAEATGKLESMSQFLDELPVVQAKVKSQITPDKYGVEVRHSAFSKNR